MEESAVFENKDGKRTVNEEYLKGTIQGMMRSYDSDNNKYLTRDEFRTFLHDLNTTINTGSSKMPKAIESDQLDLIFEKVDVSNDGTITR